VQLITERLVLRDFVPEDLDDVYAYGSDPEVVRYMPFPPSTRDGTRAHIERCMAAAAAEPRNVYDLGIVLKDEGRVIGGCTLHVYDTQSRQAAFSYLLGRHYWGRGYATEAMRALLGFGFDTLGIHRAHDACDAENLASARVMEKLGMRREGHQRQVEWDGERWADALLYAILEDEWRAKWGAENAAR
jgi:[ribosomal protein S5]-alanine N-acetyltransferase